MDGSDAGSDPGSEWSRALLDAVTTIGADLDLAGVLERFVGAATRLTAAPYGVLSVLGADDRVVEQVTTGADPASGPPPPGALPALEVAVRIRGTTFATLHLGGRSAGEPFAVRDEQAARHLAVVAAAVIDHARDHAMSERRRAWLEATAELTEILQPPIDLGRARQQIATAARSVSGSLTAAVVGLRQDSVVEVLALAGSRQHLDVALMAAIADGLSDGSDGGVLGLSLVGRLAVVVPLRSHLAERAALVAVYDADHHDGHDQDVEERELLASFADQAALALDRAQALDERQHLALVQDRERIARALHDVVIQRLFAAGLQLQALRSTVTQEGIVDRIDVMVSELDQTIRDIRTTIFALQDRTVDLPPGGRSAL